MMTSRSKAFAAFFIVRGKGTYMNFQMSQTAGLKFRGIGKCVFFLFSMVVSIILFADNSFAAHPLITDDTGTQGKGKFQLEVNLEYSKNSGDSGTQLNATFSAGIRENIDIVIGAPYQFLSTKINGGTITDDGITDIPVELKWRFYEKDGLSSAIKPGIIFPIGDEKKGLGDGKASYSLFFITTKEMDPLTFHLNLGYIKNRKELRDIWHYSLAAEYGLSKPLTLVANIGGETNPDMESNVHPLFLLGGMIYKINENFSIDFGLKTGLNKAEADYTVLAGIILDL